jgi:hypothetical protein
MWAPPFFSISSPRHTPPSSLELPAPSPPRSPSRRARRATSAWSSPSRSWAPRPESCSRGRRPWRQRRRTSTAREVAVLGNVPALAARAGWGGAVSAGEHRLWCRWPRPLALRVRASSAAQASTHRHAESG